MAPRTSRLTTEGEQWPRLLLVTCPWYDREQRNSGNRMEDIGDGSKEATKKKHTPTHYFTRALSFNFSPLLPVLRGARKPKWLPLLENLIILHCLPRFPCYARTHRSCARRKFLDVKMACIKLPELNEMRMYTHRGWPEKRKRTLCPARLQFPNLARKCSFR